MRAAVPVYGNCRAFFSLDRLQNFQSIFHSGKVGKEPAALAQFRIAGKLFIQFRLGDDGAVDAEYQRYFRMVFEQLQPGGKLSGMPAVKEFQMNGFPIFL